jgi:multisubunit Na+/H+ antiporter MnhB subunit
LTVACRLAIFVCLAPAIGCTTFALIHRITGGQWTAGLAPFIRAGVGLLPWTWVVAVPVLLAARKHYSPGLGYDGFAMVAARAVLFAVLFFGLRWALSDGLGSEEDARKNGRPWAGPVGLIILFFMLTFLADDWLESLEQDWHSTAFTVVWIAGQAMCGLSLCILGGLRVGTRPATKGSAGRPLGLDWGNLLLASMMFWAYVSFAQFLIIWAGNMPIETSWYLRREHGAWEFVMPAVALLGFALPFLLLLSRRLKQSTAGLASVAGMLLLAQLAYTAWLIVPAEGIQTPAGELLAAVVLAGAAALFANRFMRAARLLGRHA